MGAPGFAKDIGVGGDAQYGLLELTRAEQPTTLVFTNGREVIGKASREVESGSMWINAEIPGLLTLRAKYFGGLKIGGNTCPALQKIYCVGGDG